MLSTSRRNGETGAPKKGKNMSIKGKEAIAEMAKGSGSSRYIRLQDDGDTITGAFLGEPEASEIVWVDGKTEEFDKNEARHCDLEVRTVVAWNFLDREKDEVRVWERGITFFHQWKRQADKHGLQNWFTIERSGKAGSKKTTYLLEREAQIDEEKWKELQSRELHDLGRDAPPPKLADEENDTDHGAQKDLFLTPAVANDLKQLLKEMPEESIDKFLAHFAIKRVKDVPREQEQSAIRFVDMLAAPSTTNAQKTREVDPFA